MAAIVHQHDKRSGITYAYESISYWDKEKQQSRSKRRLIGRVNEDGSITPTRKKKEAGKDAYAKRSYAGATYLFDQIAAAIGLIQDLKSVFGDAHEKLLSIAYYLILEDKNPLSRFSKWSALHKHPFGSDIPSQRSSELFASITEDDKQAFFSLRAKRQGGGDFWFYDTTSLSSYSQCLSQVRYGRNKDHDNLPQINLATLVSSESSLPTYFRKLAGNITDVTIIKGLIADMGFLKYKKVKLVMDRGFYSEANVNALIKEHLKFIMGTKVSLKWVRAHLDRVRTDMRDFTSYSPDHDLFGIGITHQWDYTQDHPYLGTKETSHKRMYLHLYFNGDKALDDEKALSKRLNLLRQELEEGKRIFVHEKDYRRYFEVKETPKRGIKVVVNREAVEEAKRDFGYFALMSNGVKEPWEALGIYRSKDLIEKSYENLKDRLNFKRTLVSSEQSLDGKLFVEFIALIIMSEIKRRLTDSGLFEHYTMTEVFDELDVIECFEREGKKQRFGEITKKQNDLYEALGVNTPSSL